MSSWFEKAAFTQHHHFEFSFQLFVLVEDILLLPCVCSVLGPTQSLVGLTSLGAVKNKHNNFLILILAASGAVKNKQEFLSFNINTYFYKLQYRITHERLIM